MSIEIGNKVVYPSQGPCMVSAILEKEVAGQMTGFYRLILLDGTNGELFVPVERAKALGVRPLLHKDEIPKLLQQLRKTGEVSSDWKQRAQDNLKLLNSGSAFDLAVIVESLTEVHRKKPLTFRENNLMERAKRLLVCELSEVLGKTKLAAEEQIDQALQARPELAVETVAR